MPLFKNCYYSTNAKNKYYPRFPVFEQTLKVSLGVLVFQNQSKFQNIADFFNAKAKIPWRSLFRTLINQKLLTTILWPRNSDLKKEALTHNL